ncbi:MAG: winged helix-turn-helix domain-containing protein [Thermoplasmata archaeon]
MDKIFTLVNSFKNKTKLQIIIILLKYGSMTATQISKKIGTTRSNVYQLMKELLEDGIVQLKETRVVKNYVEKFYKLNIDLFLEIKTKDLLSEINKIEVNDLREIIKNFLNASSLVLNTMEEEINFMSIEELSELKENILKNMVILSISSLTEKHSKRFSEIFNNFMSEIESEESNMDKDENFLIVILFPLLLNNSKINN